MYVNPASDFGPSSPVADSNSATLHVVSVVSATVISTISMAAVPSNDVPPIALPVANAVAVADNHVQLAELPVVLWLRVPTVTSPVLSIDTSPDNAAAVNPVPSPINN